MCTEIALLLRFLCCLSCIDTNKLQKSTLQSWIFNRALAAGGFGKNSTLLLRFIDAFRRLVALGGLAALVRWPWGTSVPYVVPDRCSPTSPRSHRLEQRHNYLTLYFRVFWPLSTFFLLYLCFHSTLVFLCLYG